jgi:hypothetical protein
MDKLISKVTYELDPKKIEFRKTPGIDLDVVSPSIVEDAVRAALNVCEDAYGWRYLDRDDKTNSKGRLFNVPIVVPREKQKLFETQWPAYTFVWDRALRHHDHPSSHLSTELGEMGMVEPWVAEKERYIDLFGNPARDKKYKRNAVPVVTYATPKDYLRKLHHHAGCVKFDMNALCDEKTFLGGIKKIAITHALYYLKMSDIGRLLHTSEGRTIRALIHRHEFTSGTLNQGEQQYVVDEMGMVTQWNTMTGEAYRHPSLEALFHQSSAMTEFGGVAWTVNYAGADSFVIEFVGCPNKICEEYIPLKSLQKKSWEEYEYSNIRVKKWGKWTWLSASTSKGVVKIEDLDLFNELRRYAACKQRTPRLATEMANLARRLCNKKDLISIHGGGASEIPVASMSDYVEVARYIDVRHELDIAASMYQENKVMVAALNTYYEKGTLPSDFTRLTGLAVKTYKAIAGAKTMIEHDWQLHVDGSDTGYEIPTAAALHRTSIFGFDPECVTGPW